MSNSDLTSVLLILLLLVGLAQLLGYLFTRLRQPKVVGEILAGILLGPAVFGRLRFGTATLADLTTHHATILNFVYWLGLLLLMFLSGAETRELFTREERREVSWLAIVGTGIPFLLALGLGPWLAGPALAGPNGSRISLIINSRGGCGGHFCSRNLENIRRPRDPEYPICASGSRSGSP